MRIQAKHTHLLLLLLLGASACTSRSENALPQATETVIDFNKVRPGPKPDLRGDGYIVIYSDGVKVAPSSNPGVSGQVLTSDSPTDNDVAVIFSGHRKTIDVDVTPDPNGQPARIEFMKEVTLEVVHTEEIKPGDGPRHLTFSGPSNIELQGLRWTGGNLSLDNIRQYYAKDAGSK